MSYANLVLGNGLIKPNQNLNVKSIISDTIDCVDLTPTNIIANQEDVQTLYVNNINASLPATEILMNDLVHMTGDLQVDGNIIGNISDDVIDVNQINPKDFAYIDVTGQLNMTADINLQANNILNVNQINTGAIADITGGGGIVSSFSDLAMLNNDILDVGQFRFQTIPTLDNTETRLLCLNTGDNVVEYRDATSILNNPFDQSLNVSDNVNFNSMTSNLWKSSFDLNRNIEFLDGGSFPDVCSIGFPRTSIGGFLDVPGIANPGTSGLSSIGGRIYNDAASPPNLRWRTLTTNVDLTNPYNNDLFQTGNATLNSLVVGNINNGAGQVVFGSDINFSNNNLNNCGDIQVNGIVKNIGAPNIPFQDDIDLQTNDILNVGTLSGTTTNTTNGTFTNLTVNANADMTQGNINNVLQLNNTSASITCNPQSALVMSSGKNITISDGFYGLFAPLQTYTPSVPPAVSGFNGALWAYNSDVYWNVGSYVKNLSNPFYDKGTVTQITSISTGVTLNTTAGTITTVSTTLAGGTSATFTVTNSTCTSQSIVQATIVNYTGTYATNGFPIVNINNIAAGSFQVTLCNIGAMALNGVLKIAYTIH